MLPDYETCRNHIYGYKHSINPQIPNRITFPVFWDYKIDLEAAGESILDDKHLENTAIKLRGLLIYLKMPGANKTGVCRIQRVLKEIRPYYSDIGRINLGSGRIASYRTQMEAIYERLNSVTDGGSQPGTKSSIVGKSAILMAVWGQIPRFDVLNRRRFEKWTHSPAPARLPHINAREIWYGPSEFADIVEELDKWVLAWPVNNDGRSFNDSFFDLCPGVPPGRQIDIIYHWKMPDPRVDYRLQSQGS